MATFHNIRRFRVYHRILWVIFALFWREIVGDSVHLMSVTSTPFGVSTSLTSNFYCFLSSPDTNQLNSITSGRHVLRGSSAPYDTLLLPASSSSIPVSQYNYAWTTLPASIESQGMYYCEATSGGQTTRVPFAILANNRRFEPFQGQWTITKSVGELTALVSNPVSTPTGYINLDIRWQKQSDVASEFQEIPSGSGQTLLIFDPVTLEDAGVYATYWRDLASEFRFALTRLIVRACPANRWGPPSCNGICDNCYNGGICDDKLGECVCRPGFSGPNCLIPCGVNRFGWDCEHVCSSVNACSGGVYCMPDPVGCSCLSGYMGTSCQQTCSAGFFGADCLQNCHCEAGGSCDSFTGQCFSGRCATGWSGIYCQIPATCFPGYYGTMCLDKCNCLCDKFTGSCTAAIECLQGFFGQACDQECHCDGCNRSTGCTNLFCMTGFYGANCDQVCHNCNGCDRTTGCTNLECLTGFYGSNCETECHCLNGVACDKVTGNCEADPTTQLSLCEPGYTSDTGINLDNCQQYEGCFDSCTKTCHCDGGSCDSITGACTLSCKDGWSGLSCQTGFVDLSYVKVNAGQFMSITAVVMVDTTAVVINEVKLTYNDGQGANQNAAPIQTDNRGHYIVYTFQANPPEGNTVMGWFIFTEGVIAYGATPIFTAEYYALPLLNRIPRAVNIGMTSVTLQWDAWDPNAGDSGDGPVISYNVYRALATPNNIIATVAVPTQPQSVYNTVISPLDIGTTYNFFVRAVRDGGGGEGPPSTFVTFTTLTQTTQPRITTQPPRLITTAGATTTKTAMQTDQMTTMRGTGTELPVEDRTILDGNTSMADRTSVPPSQGTTQTVASPVAPSGNNGTDSRILTIVIAVIVMVFIILIFIIVLVWFCRKRKNRMKRYPPSIIASEADLDRLSSVLPPSHSMADTQSISTLDGIDNLALELDEKPEPAPRPKSMPALMLSSGSDTPPSSLRGRPVSAGVNQSGTASIKTRLRIPPVNIKDYANYVKGKRQTTDLRVEWDSLPKDLARPSTIAKKLEHKGKNRYRNVVAYDHSRVVLEPLEEDANSDYINACYIKGIKNPKAYIATQGPNEKTIGDYWRLVWQENISVMVMACNIFEEGRPKCAKYWPKKETPIEFHGITINLESEEQKEEFYIVRKFTLTKEGEDDVREITQFHYTQWPDKDVPKHCTPVLKFIDVIKENFDKKSPLLTHCSAGAGRTGAILAIHAMMELTEEKGQVDIYNFVFSMRNSRPNIVQTSSQYTFVHDAMLEYLFCKNTFIEASVFANRLKSLQEQSVETGNTFLEDEYKILNLVSPGLGAEKTRGSMKSENSHKVRSMDSLPVDSSRPYLMTPRGDDDQSPYINAAYMDGYKKKDLFITTQMPMADTVVDLWRMMYDYNCTSIVQLNAMDPEDEKNCPQFWPDAGTNEYGPFTVSLLDKESTQDFEARTLQLVYTKRDVKSPIPVRHFQYMTWSMGDERPATSDGILQLISAVEKWQKTLESPGPIVVLCMNAAGRTGAFCTIQTCLDQIREEQGVDVLQNVKLLRIHRTNMVDTPAKYMFCYETILDYLKAFDDYSNNKENQIKEVPKPKQPEEDEVDTPLYDNVVRPKKEAPKKDRKLSKKERKQEAKLAAASNIPADGDEKAAAENEDKTGPETEADQAPEIKTKSPGSKGKAEGGVSSKLSAKWGKKSKKKSTKKQDQTYENIMFDTKL